MALIRLTLKSTDTAYPKVFDVYMALAYPFMIKHSCLARAREVTKWSDVLPGILAVVQCSLFTYLPMTMR